MCAKIAIDVDDTLYSFTDLAREILADEAKRTGDTKLIQTAYAPWSEWRTPADMLELERWIEIINIAHSDDNISSARPFRGAADVLRWIENSGHDLIYISNRNPKTYNVTLEWLEDYGFPINNHKLICTVDNKAPFISHCQYIIDDRPKTLVEFVYDYDWKNHYGSCNAEKARKGFGLHRPYNESLTDVPGVYLAPSWGLLAVYLTEKGVIDEVSLGV